MADCADIVLGEKLKNVEINRSIDGSWRCNLGLDSIDCQHDDVE